MRMFFVLLSLLFFPAEVLANYHCTGKLKHLGANDIMLNIDNGYGVHRICRLDKDYCKFWASLATTAELSEREVRLYFRSSTISGNQNRGECQEIGSWVTVIDDVYYLQML